MSEEADRIPFFRLADSKDLLIFPVIEHSHFRRVLIEHLNILAWIGNIVMFGQPAAEAFQGGKMGVGGSVDVFFQDMLDVAIDVFGLEVGGVNRCKGDKSFDDHFVMDLRARCVTPIITEPSCDCLIEWHPCPPLKQASPQSTLLLYYIVYEQNARNVPEIIENVISFPS